LVNYIVDQTDFGNKYFNPNKEKLLIRDDNKSETILIKDQNLFFKSTVLLRSDDNQFRSNNYLNILGNLYSKLSDNIFSKINIPSQTFNENLKDMLLVSNEVLEFYSDYKTYRLNINKILIWIRKKQELNTIGHNADVPFNSEKLDINTVLVFNLIAAYFHDFSGNYYAALFHIKKFFYVLKDCLLMLQINFKNSFKKQSIQLKNLKDIIDKIGAQAFYVSGLSYRISNRPQLLKYRETLRLDYNRKNSPERLYSSLTNSADIKEIVLLIEEVKLKLNVLNVSEESNFHNIKLPFINPYSIITCRFTRMLELKYRCEANFYVLKYVLGFNDIFEINLNNDKINLFRSYFKKDSSFMKSDYSALLNVVTYVRKNYNVLIADKSDECIKANGIYLKEFIKFIINESIYALFEVIKTLEIYGHNYFASYSYLANAHYKLANWTDALDNMVDITFELDNPYKCKSHQNLIDHKRNYEEPLRKNLLGTDTVYYLEAHYHNELAIEYYYSAIKMHQEGDSYKKQFQNMFFLEDHFNENYIHFCAASERFRIGLVRARIEILKKKVESSLIFKYESYIKK